MKSNSRLRTLLIFFAVGLVIFLAVSYYRGAFGAEDTVEALKALCDGAFVPGAVYLCVGALVFCNNQGAFDGISYAFKAGLHGLVPLAKSPGKFGDYRLDRHKTPSKFAEMLISGGIFMLAAVVLMLIYMSLEQ